MKKVYLTLFSIATIGMSFAQVTLTGADINPVVGESFNFQQTNYVSPGSAGAAQTWDLSSMSAGSAQVVNYSAANAGFPQTNFTAEYVGNSNLYQEMSNSTIDIWGMEAGGVVFTYSDAMKYHDFPLALGNSGSDSHMATFNSGGIAFTRAGNTTWEADGYGTVITPNGTYTDVVRVRLTQVYTDTYFGGTIDYDVEIYIWYKAGVHHPVASVTSLTTFQGTSETGTFLAGNVGLEQNEMLDVSIYPNPTSDLLNIQTEGDIEEVVITDLGGKEVVKTAANVIDLQNVEAGVYFVTVYSKAGLVSERLKFVKQ